MNNQHDDLNQLQVLTGLPENIIKDVHEDFMQNSTWGRSHQKADLWYEEVKNIQINSVSPIPSTDLIPGNIFSFLNPKTTEAFSVYRFKRQAGEKDFRGLVYKIN